MTATDTRETILDSAEQLFSEQGFAATSLRAITARAGANLAAVNYHFGSKDALAKEVLARRLQPLNQERLRRLDSAVRKDPTAIGEIVRAFVVPALELNREEGAGEGLKRLLGLVLAEQPAFLEDLFKQQFSEIVRRFSAALQDALPRLSPPDVFWRMHFMVGAMAHTLCGSSRLLQTFSGGLCDPMDMVHLTDQLVRFVVGGLRAPAQGELQ